MVKKVFAWGTIGTSATFGRFQFHGARVSYKWYQNLRLCSRARRKPSQRLKSNGVRLVFEESATGSFDETNFIHPKSLNGVQFEIFRPTGIFNV